MRKLLISACALSMSLTLIQCSSKTKNESSSAAQAAVESPGTLIEESTARGKKGGTQAGKSSPITNIATTQKSTTAEPSVYAQLNLHIKNQDDDSGGSQSSLEEFANNLNEFAKSGRKDPLGGRQDIIEKIIQS